MTGDVINDDEVTYTDVRIQCIFYDSDGNKTPGSPKEDTIDEIGPGAKKSFRANVPGSYEKEVTGSARIHPDEEIGIALNPDA